MHNVLGVILAREGSKGIKLKNLVEVNNISLIKTIFVSKSSKYIKSLFFLNQKKL